MQSLSSGIYSVVSILFLITAIVLRFSALLLNSSPRLIIAFYISVVLAVVFIILRTLKENGYSKAFELNKRYHLDLVAYFSCVGFFVDFVHQCVRIYLSIQSGDCKSFAVFSPIVLSCVLSLLSCFYFVTVAMSFKDIGYDFRSLRLLHITPMLWALSNLLSALTEPVSALKEVNSVVKYAVIISSVAYYFFFARETENDGTAKKAIVMLSRIFSALALIFFADRVMLLVTGNAEMLDNGSVFGASILMISFFPLVQQRSITNSIEGV